MKKLVLASLGFAFLQLNAIAASISIGNLSGAEFTAILPQSGLTPVSSGIVALGTFSTEPTTAADILGSFSQLGNGVGFFGAAAPGYFAGSVNGAITDPGVFVGKTVYAVFGNGATIATSTELAVWKAVTNAEGNTFTADNPVGGPNSVLTFASRGTLLVGTIVPLYNSGQAGFAAQPAFRLASVVPIPEPSALLLSALGALALLRRKR
jgi:PEP-CTERM motif